MKNREMKKESTKCQIMNVACRNDDGTKARAGNKVLGTNDSAYN